MKHRISVEPSCIVASPIDVKLRDMFSFVRRQYTIGRCYSPRLWMLSLLYCCTSQAIFLGGATAIIAGAYWNAPWVWRPVLATVVLYTLFVARGWLRQDASYYFLGSRWSDLRRARLFDVWLAPVTSLAICGGLVASAIGRRIVWKGIAYQMLRDGTVTSVTRDDDRPADADARTRRLAA
jgi:hypothetical protein